MGDKEFPEKVTKENFSELVEKAKKIKKRAFWLMFAVLGVYVVVSFFLILPLTYFVVFVLKPSIPELSTEVFDYVFIGVFFVVFLSVVYLFLDFTIWVFERFLGLPKSEEKVFAGCFMVANYLVRNEKKKALKEVKGFTRFLSVFLKDSGKIKKKAYSTEFKLLIKGKTQIKRMLLFSKKDVTKLLTNFGLSFVRGEDHEAFSNLTKLIKEVLKYGEPKGIFSRFVTSLSQIKPLLSFITAIVGLVVVILKVIGIF